jgi:hypothetical protein
MPNLSELKAQLAVMRQGWKLVHSDSPAELYLRDCEENLMLIQIEAESLRIALKHEILLVKKVYVTKDDKTIVRTAFGWESIRETAIGLVNDREIKGIAYYENEIIKCYATKQQPEANREQTAESSGTVLAVDQQAKV